MADDTTAADAEATADANERSADASERGATANKEIVESLKLALGTQTKTTAELDAQLLELQKQRTASESLYVSQARNREIAKVELEIKEQQLKILDEQIKAGKELGTTEQKRYEDLQKWLPKIKKAQEENNKLIEGSGNLLEDKVGGAVLRVADMMERDWGSRLNAVSNSVSAMADNGFGRLTAAAKGLVFQLDGIQAGFEKQYQMGPAMSDSINRQYDSMTLYGISIDEAYKASGNLISTMTDFTMLGQEQQASISSAGLLLQEQGIAIEDFSKGMQNSTKFFGQSAAAAIVTQQELAASARALGRVPAEFAAEFASAGPQLAKFGDQGIKAFKDLGRISKITGMELSKVLSITNRFDTFEGAAEQAGKLNAAMGGNMVNAMDMMMETDPAARFETLRESIMNTVGTFDEMSYYQKQFYTESLGLSDVGDLALMMAGDMDSLSGAQNQNAESLIEQKKRAKDVQSAQESLTLTMHNLVNALLPARDMLQSISHWVRDNEKKVAAFVYVMVGLKTIMIAYNIVQAIQMSRLPSQAVLTANLTAATNLQAAATGRLAATVAVLSGEEVVLAAIQPVLGPGIVGTGSAAATAIAPFIGFAAAALGVGIAVVLAGAGIGVLAAGFSLLSVEQMFGMVVALSAITVGLMFFSASIFPAAAAIELLGGAAVIASPGLAIISGWVISMAASIFIVGAGIALMAAGVGYMFTQIDVAKAIAFGLLVWGLAAASPGLLVAGAAFVALGVGMLAFGLSLKMISSKDLESMATFASGLAGLDVSNVEALVKALKGVGDAMKAIPPQKAILLTATMQSAAVAAQAANLLAARPAAAPPAASPSNNSQSIRQPDVHVTLEIGGELLTKTIIKAVKDGKASGVTPDSGGVLR
jgi:F0F1-type ATP synthase delta subunit